MTRIELLSDVLAVLSDADIESASEVVELLNHLRCRGDLRALWRPMELPATARRNLASKDGDPAP